MTPARWAMLWALVFLIELYLLLADIPLLEPPRRKLLDQSPPIAELIHRQNSVRIKDPGDVVWREQLTSAELYESQSLMTLTNSTAQIRMHSGEELAVAPESLIELRRESGANAPLVISLLKGKVSGRKLDRDLELQTRSRKVRISAGAEWTLRESVETPGAQVLELREGSARIETESGGTEIRAGQAVRLNPQEKPVVRPVELTPAEEIWEKSAKPIPLNIRIKKEETPPPPPSPKVLPPPEHLKKPQFRRKSQRNRHIPITWLLDLLVPSAEAAPKESPTKNSWDVKLDWEPVKGAEGYRIQISRLKSFTYPLVNTEVSTTEYHWAYQLGMENTKGRVYYRIASIASGGKVGKFSAPITLEIPPEILAEARAKPKSAPVAKAAAPTRFSWQAAYATGLGNLSQTSSASGLETVKMDSIFFHQNISGGGIWKNDLTELALNLKLGAANFSDSDEYPRTAQETARAWNLRLDGTFTRAPESPWRFGATISRQFRWVKDGRQSVTPTGAFSVGPYVSYSLKISKPQSFSATPVQVDLALVAPATGLLTKDYYGAEFQVTGLWMLARLGSPDLDRPKPRMNWIGLQIAADARYLRWSTPTSTSLFAWNVWIAPTFQSEE